MLGILIRLWKWRGRRRSWLRNYVHINLTKRFGGLVGGE